MVGRKEGVKTEKLKNDSKASGANTGQPLVLLKFYAEAGKTNSAITAAGASMAQRLRLLLMACSTATIC